MAKWIEQFLDCGTIIGLDNKRVLIGYGCRQWHSKQPPKSLSAFYFPDFFLTHATPWFTHASCSEHGLSDFLNALTQSKQKACKPKNRWSNRYKPIFSTVFSETQQLFKQGILQKAVPFVFEESEDSFTPENLLHALIHAATYAARHQVSIYGFWNRSEGMLGVTPELLFSCSEQKLHTMACAGTIPSGQSEEHLLNDGKQRREHQFVIDDIASSLEPFGSVAIAPTSTLKLSHLTHLVTPLSVQLRRNATFNDIVNALHPTAALGVFPKEEGKHWLKRYQTHIDRKRFGAPVGCVYGKEARCLVAIRNIQWNENGILLGAGAGIVADSDVEKEWQEIQLKIHTTKKILGLM